jgi:hypothetical protein
MDWWTPSKTIKPALIAFALYIAVAGYLKYTYVPQPDPFPRVYISGPFYKLGGSSYAATFPPRENTGAADSADNPTRSTFQLYEDEKPIGPAHSLNADIANLGGGRYSHWQTDKGPALNFSATDNSDPNSSGKRYSYPKPRRAD